MTKCEDRFKRTYDSLKGHKASGIDEVDVNVIKSVYVQIKTPLLHVFNISMKFALFPKKIKIAKIYPIFKVRLPPSNFFLFASMIALQQWWKMLFISS